MWFQDTLRTFPNRICLDTANYSEEGQVNDCLLEGGTMKNQPLATNRTASPSPRQQAFDLFFVIKD